MLCDVDVHDVAATPPLLHDRGDAGRRLGDALTMLRGTPGLLVLGLPRGGVAVAAETAAALDASLDILVVRKLGVPTQRELAMGAIASGGIRVLNRELVARLGVSDAVLDAVTARERAALERSERRYRGDTPAVTRDGRVVILVDDGAATGATMRAAVASARAAGATRVVVATPVASAAACRDLATAADELVCLDTPDPFIAVGAHYEDFAPCDDATVCALLAAGRRHGGGGDIAS